MGLTVWVRAQDDVIAADWADIARATDVYPRVNARPADWWRGDLEPGTASAPRRVMRAYALLLGNSPRVPVCLSTRVKMPAPPAGSSGSHVWQHSVAVVASRSSSAHRSQHSASRSARAGRANVRDPCRAKVWATPLSDTASPGRHQHQRARRSPPDGQAAPPADTVQRFTAAITQAYRLAQPYQSYLGRHVGCRGGGGCHLRRRGCGSVALEESRGQGVFRGGGLHRAARMSLLIL